jgi:hypothetical protein
LYSTETNAINSKLGFPMAEFFGLSRAFLESMIWLSRRAARVKTLETLIASSLSDHSVDYDALLEHRRVLPPFDCPTRLVGSCQSQGSPILGAPNLRMRCTCRPAMLRTIPRIPFACSNSASKVVGRDKANRACSRSRHIKATSAVLFHRSMP